MATQKNKNRYPEAEIGDANDSDLSYPFYSYTDAEYDSTLMGFKSTEYTTTAKPEYVDSTGWLRSGYDIENVPATKDTVITLRKITPAGAIITLGKQKAGKFIK